MDLQSMKAAMESRRKVVTVDVTELGGEVRIKPLDARAGIAIASKFSGLDEGGTDAQIDAFVALIAASVVDDDGTAILDSDDGRAFIASWSPGLVMQLGQAAAEVNGLAGKN